MGRTKRGIFFSSGDLFRLIVYVFLESVMLLQLEPKISFVTGMEEASCEKAVYVSQYVDNTDDFGIIQGPAARIRPTHLPDNFFSCEFTVSGSSNVTKCLFHL